MAGVVVVPMEDMNVSELLGLSESRETSLSARRYSRIATENRVLQAALRFNPIHSHLCPFCAVCAHSCGSLLPPDHHPKFFISHQNHLTLPVHAHSMESNAFGVCSDSSRWLHKLHHPDRLRCHARHLGMAFCHFLDLDSFSFLSVLGHGWR